MGGPAPTGPADGGHGLPEIVRAFKAFSARRINEIRNTPGATVWQRNYYERIVRNERKLNAARNDILGNPANWTRGVENRDFWGSVAGRNG